MNFLEIYENACNTCGVRPNSLLHKTLREAPVRPITHLRLADNYVGPKGFLALIPLIEKCQTLESLDLRGNGLDNSSIIALSRALRSHLGIHTIDLSRNPISAEGGRHLLELLETNTHIVHLVVEQTDLFDAFVERLYMTAAQNQGDTDNRPIIVPSRFNNNNNKDSKRESLLDDESSTGTFSPAGSTSTSAGYHRHPRNAPPGRKASAATSIFSGDGDNSISQHPVSGGASTSKQFLGGRSESTSAVHHQERNLSPSGGANRHHNYNTNNQNQQHSSPSPNNNQRNRADSSAADHNQRASQANITGVLKPKPPTPAIASEAYSRLTKEQRDLMKERYKQKAAVFTQVEQTASHKLAADFRAEIALLEGAQAKSDYSRQGLHSSSPSSSSAQQQQQLQRQQQQQEQEEQEEQENQQNTTSVVPPRESPESRFFNDNDSKRNSPDEGKKSPAASSSTEKRKPAIEHAASEEEKEAQQKASSPTTTTKNNKPAPVLVSVPMVPISAPDLNSNAALTPADQFRTLFNQGCAYYNEKNFDAAYCSWNEAVYIATQERNREWLTIVQSNLQNLSFEMLTTEAQDAIDRSDLDDASRSLELALKLATKARNAGWEAEVIKLRRNVLHGSFQANHDKATSLLEQLVKLEPIDVTDDHRFVSPTGKLEAHTTAFVNEWTMLLIVKELMEKCVQSHRCARGIGGNNGAALEQLVQGTVTTVSKHLINLYWSARLHDPMSIAWLGAGRFSGDERESLIQLWADLRGTVKELGHPLWFVVELSQYGNLLLASHELTGALDCFEKAAEHAGECNDRFLTGTSLLFCGIVNLQRSSYAKAEALFRSALTELGECRFGVAPLRPPKMTSAATAGVNSENEPQFVTRDTGNSPPSKDSSTNNNKSSSAANSTKNNKNNNSNLDSSASLTCKPSLEDLCFFHSQGFLMLSRTLIGSYRYRDALEVHERFLLYQHHDVLFEKLQSNFSGMPTTDHLRATSATLNHPLVYYAVHYRYDWNLDKHHYDVSEHIYSWIVVSEGDGKFNSVDISSELGVPSLLHTIKEARRTLYVDADSSSSSSSRSNNNKHTGVVMNLDDVAWKGPLRKLYKALMHQVIDVLSSYAAYSDLGMFTVIPHGFLWLVPFPALLDERDQFLLERITLCHAVCATQVLMSELSVRHLLANHNTKNMVIRPPPQLVDPSSADRDMIGAMNKSKSTDEGLDYDDDDEDEETSSDDDEEEEIEKNDDDDDDGEDNNNNSEQKKKSKTNSTSNKKNQKKNSKNKNNAGGATVEEVLRNGITEEQMNEEATQLVRALGSGTLDMSGTSTDVLAQIAFTNISVLCSSIVTTSTSRSLTAGGGEMRGGIRVASSFDTTGVLSCEEIAFSNLPIETVILPYSSLDVETISRDATSEAILSMSRAFLGSGTVSVLFSTWQCSDVYPADFLKPFARDLQHQQNRAVALAKAVRSLIQEEQREAMTIGSTSDESRPLSCFKPRRWAGIILMGVSEVPHEFYNARNQQHYSNDDGQHNNNQSSNFNEFNAFA